MQDPIPESILFDFQARTMLTEYSNFQDLKSEMTSSS